MPFGEFIHQHVDEIVFFDILRQDGYKILRGFCDYLAEKLYLCTVKQIKLRIMPQLFTLFGLRFMFYSNDHEPIHVHVVKGGAEARFQVQPEIALLDNKGLKPAELKLAEAIVEENREIITARWNEYFKKH